MLENSVDGNLRYYKRKLKERQDADWWARPDGMPSLFIMLNPLIKPLAILFYRMQIDDLEELKKKS